MPTVSVKKELLFKALKQSFTDEEFGSLCFDFGLELEDVTTDSAEPGKGGEVVYKLDVPANRYDLLCLEGLSVALLVFLNKMNYPNYRAIAPSDPKDLQRLIIKPDTKLIRPYAVGAVLRGIKFSADSYASFIELQDKLHQNLARKRTLVAIGTHDLDTIRGPFVYDALPPEQIKFKPLNHDKEITAPEIMQLYSNHAQLKQYLGIIRESPVYPVISDSDGVVLSMPPIINGDHSKITLNTSNVFIEVTATNLHKAQVVLDTLTTAFSALCKEAYTAETIEVSWADGSVHRTPHYAFRKEVINVKQLNSYIGIKESSVRLAQLLSRMGLSGRSIGAGEVLVRVPPTRHDIIHAVDVYEDAAIAFGYNNIVETLPKTLTIASQFPLNKLSDQLREVIAQSGFTEALTFALCSRDDISIKLNKPWREGCAVEVGNPKTSEFQVGRSSLVSGLLKCVASNKSSPLPIKLFELSDVLLVDPATETGARNRREVSAIYYDKRAGFEKVHGLLDRIMHSLQVPWNTPQGYRITQINDEMYLGGRCAAVEWCGIVVGSLGVVHPTVIRSFELSLPAAVLQLNIEPFL